MAMALCTNCGDIKWGAFSPCPNCAVASTGNSDLDISLSDHCVKVAQLDLMGDVIRQINALTDDKTLRENAFTKYMERNPIPSSMNGDRFPAPVFKVELAPDRIQPVEKILAKLQPPRAGTGSPNSTLSETNSPTTYFVWALGSLIILLYWLL